MDVARNGGISLELIFVYEYSLSPSIEGITSHLVFALRWIFHLSIAEINQELHSFLSQMEALLVVGDGCENGNAIEVDLWNIDVDYLS